METPVLASEKVVRAIMAEEGLVPRKAAQMARRARYSSYAGELSERPLVLHTDGGSVYMTDDWADACEEGHVVRSMSRKARSLDNARAELDRYIEWYRSGKLKKPLGWRTIRQAREELAEAG